MAVISIQTLSNMIRRGETEAALAATVALTQSVLVDAEAWSARAFVEEMLERFDAAETSITQAWTLEPSPDFQFKRAGIRLKAGHTQAALADALAVVATGEGFFHDEALLLAAEAWRRMGQWSDALKTCDELPDDTEVWSGGLVTAREIRAQCERMLMHRRAA